MSLDGKEIAFGVDVTDGNTRRGVLGGSFPEIQGTGYGMTLMAGPRERRLSYRTEVSSNNPHVLRVHQNFGRVVYKEQYVLRKFMPELSRGGEQGECRDGSNV